MPDAHLGIEIGATKLQLLVGNAQGQIIDRARLAVDRARGGEGIREQIRATWLGWCTQYEFGAVGVGYGGPVDFRTGKICCSHHVQGWDEFPLGDWLREMTGLAVAVDNDSNAAALGETLFGAGLGCDPVFYTNSGSGVGGGLISDRRVYHGAVPGEAEFGHLRLDRTGTIVENRCSGWAVDRKIRAVIAAGTNTLLKALVGKSTEGESRHLAIAIAQQDTVAIQILKETADDLAFALSHVVHLFHPGVIVLGGGLSLLGEPWRAAIESSLPAYVMQAFQPPPAVRIAALGEDSVPMGALALARLARLT